MSKRGQMTVLIAASLLLAAASPFLGVSGLSLNIWDLNEPEGRIFWLLRVPRAIAAFFAGAGLSISGMVFQAMFRNPLASPFTLGISSGAALGASTYFWLGAGLSFLGSSGSLGAAMAGGALSMGLVFLVTRARGHLSTAVMLLTGVIINFFFDSLVMLIQYLSDAYNSLRIMHWLMGSLAGVEPARLPELIFVILAGAFFIRMRSNELDLLTAGEELAASRGVKVSQIKLHIFVAASIMVGAIISMTGPIGFVGMMVPHICRLSFGWSHRLLLPAAFFMGGAFLCLCDLVARTILAPAELPIGIITAILGGPFFLYVIFRSGKNDGFFY